MEFLYRIIASIRKRSGDWVAITLALLLAAGIWLLTNLSRNYVAVLSVNVIAETSLDGRAATSADRAVIQARCRASGFRIRQLRRQARTSARTVVFQPADFHPVEGREDFFAIPASQLEHYVAQLYGDNVHLENFVTDEAIFRFPAEAHKKVPVVPVKDIRFRSQYMELSPLSVDPDSVTVYGEPHLLERVTQVRTSPIRLNDVASSIQDEISLYPIQGVRFVPSTVKYSLPVTRFVEMGANVPVRVAGVPQGMQLSCFPDRVRVTLLSVFPMLSDPLQNLVLEVPYDDFRRSLSGDCVPLIKAPLRGVISVKVEPEVVHVVEVAR